MEFSEAVSKRSYRLNMLIGLIGATFLMAFAANAMSNGKLILAASLAIAALAGLGSLVLMRRTGELRYGAHGVSFAAAYVYIYLIISGGAEGTGPLWCYPLVALITFLQGMRRGIYITVGLTVASLILMFVPNLPFTVAEYGTTFKIRFIASFLALAMMTLIYEYLRSESQSRYRAISSELDKASRTDELTGLANRREMNDLLEMEYANYIRHGQPFSVIMVDLDRFKQLNDNFGHAFGDQTLVDVASRLATNIRRSDHVARWGGEEFLILLPQTDLAQASRLAEKLRLAIAAFKPKGAAQGGTVTASMGVQSIEFAPTLANLITGADDRLYQAKNRGRNRVVAGNLADAAASSP